MDGEKGEVRRAGNELYRGNVTNEAKAREPVCEALNEVSSLDINLEDLRIRLYVPIGARHFGPRIPSGST